MARRRRGLVRVKYGPFIGVRSQSQTTPYDPRYADTLLNCYPIDTEFGPVVVGRPGFAKMGSQIGTVSSRAGQRGYQYTQLDGDEATVAVCGGEIATYDWGGNAWTTKVTQANLTTAAAALATTGLVYSLTVADKMLLNDGTNTPILWDGTSGAGGITELTNTPSGGLFGKPWLYYGKLFGIRTSSRTTIVWSEEGDPTTGYLAGGYNNGWDLIQTDPNALYAGVGLNEVMYLFRANSITAVSGAVAADFTTSGQREAVSEDVGCISPEAITVKDGTVYFLGANRRLYRIRGGGLLEEVAKGARPVLDTLPRTYLPNAHARPMPGTDLVLFFVAGLGSTSLNTMLAVDTRTGEYAGLFVGFAGTTLDVVKNADGLATLMHLGGSASADVNEGYAYYHGRPDGSLWSDGFHDATAAINHGLTCEPGGYDEALEKAWERIDVTVTLRSQLSGLGVGYFTPRRGSAGTQTVATLAGGGTYLNDFLLDTDTLALDSVNERHAMVGIDGQGRWIAPTLSHATAGEQFMVSTIVATGQAIDDQVEYY